MLIEEANLSEAESIDASATLEAATRRMTGRGARWLPVTRDSQVIGVIHERDIMDRVAADEGEPCPKSVEDVMSREVVICRNRADLERAAKLVAEKKVRQLLVVV